MPQPDGGAQAETILANATLVLPGETVRGSVVLRGGLITVVDAGAAVPRNAVDCGGDLIAPGLVELHTDNLERHLLPRPGVHWPAPAAIVAHDAELAGCGVTTVFDALRVGSILTGGGGGYRKYARGVATAILALHGAGALRIRHRLHLRAEICSETLEEELAEFGPDDRIGIVSLMDHTPGQRQFADEAKHKQYVQGKHALSDAAFAEHVARLRTLKAANGARHEAAAVAEAARLGATLASHDDTTAEQVETSAAHGARIAEFPTTALAAAACRARGVAVMMGAPNLLRGGSHSGNVAAGDLAAAGLLDILSSDYAPASLLLGAIKLGLGIGDIAAGVATVTDTPAHAAGLVDRGRIAAGLKADLIRIRLDGDLPLLRGTWVGGARVA